MPRETLGHEHAWSVREDGRAGSMGAPRGGPAHPHSGLCMHTRAASPLRPQGTRLWACTAGLAGSPRPSRHAGPGHAPHPAVLEPRLRTPPDRLSFHRQPQDPSGRAFQLRPTGSFQKVGRQPQAPPTPLPQGGRPAQGDLASGPATVSFPPCPRSQPPAAPENPPGLLNTHC